MPWPLRIIENPYEGETHWEGWQIGDCWYYPFALDTLDISEEYHRDWEGKRPPIVVVLPQRSPVTGEITGWPFCVDECATDKTTGWTVTGELPNITCTPSINAVGAYHGYITDGVLSDGLA